HLPSEAEWEYACRAGSAARFSIGEDESQLAEAAWYQNDSGKIDEAHAHEAGRLAGNPFGLHDMHGNVREGCEDAYVSKLPGGTNPLVRSLGPARVFRGGAWATTAAGCRSAARDRFDRSYTDFSIGFRVARSADQDAVAPRSPWKPEGTRTGEERND